MLEIKDIVGYYVYYNGDKYLRLCEHSWYIWYEDCYQPIDEEYDELEELFQKEYIKNE